MRLRDLLNVPADGLKDWGVIVPQAVADAMAGAQTGQMRVAPVPLVDGRAMFCADVLAHEDGQWFAAGLALVERDDCQCAPWPVCVALLDRYDGDEAAQPPEWVQILGAGLGPHGAVDGWLPGSRTLWGGAVRVQRSALPAVQAPSDTDPTPWARADGRYVVPAGWEYQPDEDVTEDGEVWFRVVQATSFRPSESPAQWVQIYGPGGEPVQPLEPEPEPDAVAVYTVGETYTMPQRVTGAVGTPGEGRQWDLIAAEPQLAQQGYEPWHGYMASVWQEVTE